ncbi:MAG: hypothetical protein ABW122_07440, partial [Ilumatobacteraceae bacterium]
VVVTVLVAKAGRRALVAVAVPSIAFLVGWCVYLEWATGNPFVFWDAKDAWTELSLTTLLSDPLTYAHRPGLFHLAFMLALAVPYLMRVRHQPLSWGFVVALTVLPPFVLGVEGLARYAIMAFPMSFAAADVLATRRRWPAVAYLSVSGVGMLVLAVMVNHRSWLP